MLNCSLSFKLSTGDSEIGCSPPTDIIFTLARFADLLYLLSGLSCSNSALASPRRYGNGNSPFMTLVARETARAGVCTVSIGYIGELFFCSKLPCWYASFWQVF